MTSSPGETFWTGSDIGWVVGHSYIVYGPLLHRLRRRSCYEGKPIGTPDAGAYLARLIQDYNVSCRFSHAPTGVARGASKEDPEAKHHQKRTTSKTPCALCFSRGRARRCSGYGRLGGRKFWASRWSTTGGRPRPAGAIVANPARLRDSADQTRLDRACPCPAMTFDIVDEGATKPVPASARWVQIVIEVAVAARLPADALPSKRRGGCARATSMSSRVIYKTARRRSRSMRTGTSSRSSGGPTTSSIVAGHRLSTGGMEEVLASLAPGRSGMRGAWRQADPRSRARRPAGLWF